MLARSGKLRASFTRRDAVRLVAAASLFIFALMRLLPGDAVWAKLSVDAETRFDPEMTRIRPSSAVTLAHVPHIPRGPEARPPGLPVRSTSAYRSLHPAPLHPAYRTPFALFHPAA